MPSSRATMAAGTRPPRVTHTIAWNGPAPASRQASARASRWNWSQETGKAFCGCGWDCGSGCAMNLPRGLNSPRVLVPRTRSSHTFCGKHDCELRVQRGTRIIELLVSLDSEFRKPGCRTNDANFGIGTLAQIEHEIEPRREAVPSLRHTHQQLAPEQAVAAVGRFVRE